LSVWVGEKLLDHDLGDWFNVIADRALEVTGKIFENLNGVDFNFESVGVHRDFLITFEAFDFQRDRLMATLFFVVSTNVISSFDFEINASLGVLKKSWNESW